ncbi:hypothetical protein RSAG8_06573, partial [Rhizoctonia solani AG-8 WAC10335]
MSTDLPYAADAEVALTPEELSVLRIQYEKELSQGYVSVQTKFNYAWGLVKSHRREHQLEGVQLLLEIYRAEPARRRECLYYLALGHYKMGNLEDARKFNGTKKRMFVLSCLGTLQDGQLGGCQEIQRASTQQRANKHASPESSSAHRQ